MYVTRGDECSIPSLEPAPREATTQTQLYLSRPTSALHVSHLGMTDASTDVYDNERKTRDSSIKTPCYAACMTKGPIHTYAPF